jgi:hypothetical protein
MTVTLDTREAKDNTKNLLDASLDANAMDDTSQSNDCVEGQ